MLEANSEPADMIKIQKSKQVIQELLALAGLDVHTFFTWSNLAMMKVRRN